MTTLAGIQQRIGQVRARERSVVLAAGLCRVLVALVAAVLGYFLLDLLFDLPYAARWFFALGGLAAVAHVLNRRVLAELRKIHDDDEIALRIESRNSELKGRLISTLQLSRAQGSGTFVGSPELIAALEAETVRMTGPLNFGAIINTTLLKRLAVVAVLVVAVKGALLIQFPDYFAALGARLIQPGARFPTKTRIAQVIFKPGDIVARGEELTVEVIVGDGSYVPDQPGTLRFTPAGRMQAVQVELVPMGGRVFKGVLAKALEDMDVVAVLYDTRTEPLRVKVLGRPEVDVKASGQALHYTYPPYTNETDVPSGTFGGISALSGSTVDIRFVPTKPLKSAVLEREDGRKMEFSKSVETRREPQNPAAHAGKEPQEFTGKQVEIWSLKGLPVDKNGSFHLALVDTDNLSNSQPPVEYPIEARPDNPPSVKLLKPAQDITVTPNAKLNVQYSARDDWGLRTLWLVIRIQNESSPDAAARPEQNERIERVERIERQVDRKREIQPTTFQWDLGALNVKPTDQIVFWLEADDECAANDTVGVRVRRNPDGTLTAPDPGTKLFPRSNDVKLTVVTREEKLTELQAEMERATQQTEQAKTQQDELRPLIRETIRETIREAIPEK